MTFGNAIAAQLTRDVLADQAFVEPGVILRATAGARNRLGEFVEGTLQETEMQLVSAPVGLTGQGAAQQRQALPEGVRDADIRTFWLRGDFPSLRYGVADGDLILLGELGPETNRFTGDTRVDAETARDMYGAQNPSWLLEYRADANHLIQLGGFGSTVYQAYDPIDGTWADRPPYRAVQAARWGTFTEVVGARQDPGNEGMNSADS